MDDDTGPVNSPEHPGVYLRAEVFVAHGPSIKEAAQQLGVSRAAMSAILNGRATLTPEMAVRIEAEFGIPAKVLMEKQAAYDLAMVRQRAAAPVPPQNLEDRCRSYLSAIPGCQDLDLNADSLRGRGDFFLEREEIVIEMKNISAASIADPPTSEQRVKYSGPRVTWREYYLPWGAKIAEAWDYRHTLDRTRAVEERLRTANDQIAKTRSLLGKPNAKGVVVFICEDADLLPEDISNRYVHVQNSRAKDGIVRRFPEVLGFILLWKSNRRFTSRRHNCVVHTAGPHEPEHAEFAKHVDRIGKEMLESVRSPASTNASERKFQGGFWIGRDPQKK